jgi:hypothetical protein
MAAGGEVRLENDGEQLVSTGKQGRGEETAGEHPYRNAKLLECLLDGRAARTTAAEVRRRRRRGSFGCLGFLERNSGCGLGEKLGHREALK